METSKRTIKQVLICIGLLCVIWGVYFFSVRGIKRTNEENSIRKQAVEVDYKVLFGVERVKTEKGNISLSGWALRLNSVNSAIYLVLQPTDDSEAEVFLAECTESKEIGEYFAPKWDFGECGFTVDLNEERLKEGICYEVLIVLDYEEKTEVGESVTKTRKKITTSQYLYNGELYRYNPEDFEEPKISDAEIIHVLENGVLRAYDLKEQIWIYQYEKQLYFIVNSNYSLDKSSSIRIPVMPQTSREDLLPEERRQYGFDHLGAYHLDENYIREGVTPYQIVVVNIPTEYPLIYITTGLYDNLYQTWTKRFDIRMSDWRVYDMK